jgi:hypothetical protein
VYSKSRGLAVTVDVDLFISPQLTMILLFDAACRGFTEDVHSAKRREPRNERLADLSVRGGGLKC